MVAMAYETPSTTETLLGYFLALKTPRGFRAELIEGEVVVAPPTDGDHEDAIALVIGQVVRNSAIEMQVSGYKGLKLPSRGQNPKNHVIPDLTVASAGKRLFRGAEPWMPCDGVEMVVEVTSSKPEGDRITKRYCYAHAGIPLYLLIDRSRQSVTLFSHPDKGEYEELTCPFGEPIPLPAPFDFDLDTKDFL